MKSLVLASSSPHRASLLEKVGIDFQVIKSNIKEKWDFFKTPQDNVTRLSLQKAQEVLKNLSIDSIILAADTVVVNSQKQVYFKPKDRKEASHFLQLRSNSYEDVITGFCILDSSKIYRNSAKVTRIYYAPISLEKQNILLDTNEWQGVCGGLKIEGGIQSFIQKIEGEYENIIGLPICSILSTLKNIK